MRSGSISIGKDGFEVAVELFCGPFAAGGLRFSMKSTGNGAKLGGLKAVGVLRAAKKEAREVRDFSPLRCRQCLAELDDLHGFRAHKDSLAEKTDWAIRAAKPRWGDLQVTGKKSASSQLSDGSNKRAARQ